jgi:solute carrier family 25 phosphate transporter 23/24/25/41
LEIQTLAQHFFAGSVAGIASRTGTAPLDRLKILLQVNTGPARGIVQTIKDIYQVRPWASVSLQFGCRFITSLRAEAPYHIQEGGIRAFWRGNLANVLKATPVPHFLLKYIQS